MKGARGERLAAALALAAVLAVGGVVERAEATDDQHPALEISTYYYPSFYGPGRRLGIEWDRYANGQSRLRGVEIQWSPDGTGQWTTVGRSGDPPRIDQTYIPTEAVVVVTIEMPDTGRYFFRARIANSTLGTLPWSNVVSTDDAANQTGNPLVRTNHPNAYLGVDDALVFKVWIGGPLTRSFSLWYGTVSKNAEPPVHYTARSGQLDFAPGETVKTVRVPVHALPENRSVATMRLRTTYDAERRQQAWMSEGAIRRPQEQGGSNRAPTATNDTVTTDQDTDYAFAAADFSYSDPDGDALASVKIITLPATGKGALELHGTVISLSALPQTVTRQALAARELTYAPPPGQSGNNFMRFTFRVNDGTDDSTASYTMAIDIVSGTSQRSPLAERRAAVERRDAERAVDQAGAACPRLRLGDAGLHRDGGQRRAADHGDADAGRRDRDHRVS